MQKEYEKPNVETINFSIDSQIATGDIEIGDDNLSGGETGSDIW